MPRAGVGTGTVQLLVVGPSTELRREVSPVLYTAREIRQRLDEGNAFARRVLDQPKIFLVGSERDLPVHEPRPPGADQKSEAGTG